MRPSTVRFPRSTFTRVTGAWVTVATSAWRRSAEPRRRGFHPWCSGSSMSTRELASFTRGLGLASMAIVAALRTRRTHCKHIGTRLTLGWSSDRVEAGTSHNKVLPAPLPAVAPTYMARGICGEETEWRVSSFSRFVSPPVVGHVGNTRTLSNMGL